MQMDIYIFLFQIVFSRPGNDKLGDNDPYASFPAANQS
jgi:cyclopropane-fatty-acyl-phospholipid synthase